MSAFVNSRLKKISVKLKKQILRFFLSFAASLTITILLNDFSPMRELIQSLQINIWLRDLLVYLTKSLLSLSGFEFWSNQGFIQIYGTRGVEIVFGCLAIRHLMYFSVFIAFYYGKLIPKIIYILSGNLLITIINTIRIYIITIVQYHSDNSTEIVHDIASPVFMYTTILILWIIWIEKWGIPKYQPTKYTLP